MLPNSNLAPQHRSFLLWLRLRNIQHPPRQHALVHIIDCCGGIRRLLELDVTKAAMRFCAALVTRELDFGDAAKGEEGSVEDLFGYSIVEAA